ncbi:type 4 prepilin peptidase 1 [Marinobacterium zhoushanense]|uniref:Type 4 prepilin peptidase 1 n=1 Tax=Marinobacterium zhoushanense TaxID=1679163 RepID=A0ABQ1K5M6_9GAMM|nr:prepilin peptidase [Marinobacterium zhoushanense]GGB88761.1 type 4 prepilin peptidase 1 [Marinobacterium zhoushanense]
MLSFYTYDGSTLLLLLILLLAVVKDWRRNRIPNWLTYSSLLAGLVLQYVFLHVDGLMIGLKGAGVGLAVLLPFYLMGGMGAGDVKLMAAAGSFIGPMAAMTAACVALVVGGCVALYLILRSGELASLYRRYMVMLAARTLVPAEPGSVARHRFPFSSAIAIGVLLHQGLIGKLEFYHLTTQIGLQLQALGGAQ